MMRYSLEQLDFIRCGYKKWQIPKLTMKFNYKFGLNKTETAIKAACCNHGFKCGRPVGNPAGTLILFTKKQAAFIKKAYTKYSEAQTTVEVNKKFSTDFTQNQIVCFLNNHRILSGRTGCFEKGIIPWNTGTKGLTSRNRTTFKKGNIPLTRKPLGFERIDSKDGYVLVKTKFRNPYTGAQTMFRPKHVILWEKDHGPVPAKHVIIFKDCDKRNFDPENLVCIHRLELAQLNKLGYSNAPKELKPSIFAIVKLRAGIYKSQRGERKVA